MLSGLRRRFFPPEATHGGRSDGRGRGRSSASPAASGDRGQGKRQVTKLMEKKTKGLEAPSFPSVAVDVPDASGRTNPVALRSSVLCCVPAGEDFLAPSFPSVAVDVPDASGRTNPVALRSSMPCACSILYKTKLPFLVGMDWPGFGNLAPRKTKVTSSNRGRLSAPLGEPQCLAGAERASREVFTWSASGTILPEASARAFFLSDWTVKLEPKKRRGSGSKKAKPGGGVGKVGTPAPAQSLARRRRSRARKSAKPTVKMAPPGPELRRDHTKDGGPARKFAPGHTQDGAARTAT
ncbi:uncharacterized protein LOC116797757 [Chiroxiphia lanceolata]|uniref:uncharacterized protein LOC116797757 n=1 Tax=Chiroxiphia lanceolata TaxID=296741 RepID=UPI0013CE7C92|nr:uncharacterized protein LOC116797757 [Chiroxiphia lanceolata]